MRILVVSLNYSPELTATGKYTGEMAEWLAARGHKVTCIAAPPHYPKWEVYDGYDNKRFKKEILNGVNVLRVPCYIPNSKNINSKTRIWMELTFSILSIRWWLFLFFSKRFDLVVSICPPMQPTLFALMYSKIRNVPIVYHVQDLQVDMAARLKMIENRWLLRFLFKVEEFILNRVDLVTSITRSMNEKIKSRSLDDIRIELFPNWADISGIFPLSGENNIRKQFGFNVDDILFVYSGGIGEKQGIEIVVDAAKELSKVRNIKFLIVGEGGIKKKLLARKQQEKIDNLHFLPLQPLNRLNELLNAADVHFVIQKKNAADLVMPSKLTNILAAGKPVLATAEQGTELYRLIVEEKLGFVVAPENLDKLIKKITEIECSRTVLSEIGTRSRVYAERCLNKNSVLSRFESNLLKLVKK